MLRSVASVIRHPNSEVKQNSVDDSVAAAMCSFLKERNIARALLEKPRFERVGVFAFYFLQT